MNFNAIVLFAALVDDVDVDEAEGNALKKRQIGANAQACKATPDYDEHGVTLWV